MSTNRLRWLIGGLLACFLLLFFLLKDHPAFGPSGVVALLEQHRAVLLPLGWSLMVADLVLPVPATVIMAVFGAQWGVPGGAAAGTAGSLMAGLTAYALCRALGHRAAVVLAGNDGLRKLQGFFTQWGLLAVAVTRSLPILPETVSCLAGLARMPMGRFVFASLLGALPMAVCFAWIGHWGQVSQEPLWSLLLSAGLPVIFAIPVSWWIRNRHHREQRDDGNSKSSDNPRFPRQPTSIDREG